MNPLAIAAGGIVVMIFIGSRISFMPGRTRLGFAIQLANGFFLSAWLRAMGWL
jgi:hypothetical protein